jgi:hypothetical protein
MSLLEPSFKYVPSHRTDVSATWRRFGFRPTTETERRQRQQPPRTGTIDIDLGLPDKVMARPRPPFAVPKLKLAAAD